MKSRFEEKNQAIELRKSGLTYGEIQKTIKVSKGLLSVWLKDVELSPEKILTLKKHGEYIQNRGRLRAAITNKYKRAERENLAIETAKKKFTKLKNDSAFLIGLSLYWAHGTKKGNSFQFTSSDSDMIIFMQNWAENYLSTQKELVKKKKFGLYISGIQHLYTMNAWQKLFVAQIKH